MTKLSVIIEEVAEDGGEERCDVLDDRWFDFVDVARFVGVDLFHCFGDFGSVRFCICKLCQDIQWQGLKIAPSGFVA